MDSSTTKKVNSQVANTYELVENIPIQLYDVSPASVVKAQAVSKTFQHVYARSQQLHQLRLPMSTTFWPYFQPLPRIFSQFRLQPSLRIGGWTSGLDVKINPTELRSEQWRKGGSWRSWPVCRPTTTEITAEVTGYGKCNPRGITPGDYYEIKLSLHRAEGLTLGDLVDAAYELMDLDGSMGVDLSVEFGIGVDEKGRPLSRRGGLTTKGKKAMDFHKAMAGAWQVRKLWDGFDYDGVREEDRCTSQQNHSTFEIIGCGGDGNELLEIYPHA